MKVKRDFTPDPHLVLSLPLYKLDGASFMSRDAYGHLCTVTGASWRLDGRSFNGSSDKITIPAHASLLLGSGDWTIKFRVHLTTLIDTEYLMGTSSATKDVFISGTSGAIKIDLEGASTVTTNTGLIDTGVDIEIVIVRSGDDCIIYKNGILFQTISNGFAGGDNTTSEDLILGFNS